MKDVVNHCRRGVATVDALWRSHWSASRGRRWLVAWRDELIGMLPSRVASRLRRHGHARQVAWPLGAQLDTAQPTILLLPAHEAMVQRITLPLAATRHLHRVLRHELDKYFPYAPEQLHFVARIVRRQGARAEVELVAVARERLDEQLAHCRERGLHLHSVDVLDRHGQRRGIDLLPAGARTGTIRTVRLERWLGVACLMLVTALAVGYLHRQQQLLGAMQATVDGQREQVQHLQQLRQALDETVGAAHYLGERKAARPTISALLAELTGCLGEDHWVRELAVEDGETLTFSGQSERASALIDQVRQCPSLEQARFQGVIQTDDATGRERYSIRAQLRSRAPTVQGEDDAHIDES